jgi:hypothetical protein
MDNQLGATLVIVKATKPRLVHPQEIDTADIRRLAKKIGLTVLAISLQNHIHQSQYFM